MDLPTYTNIWRIEKRLYKLYDFRLPTPLPLVTFGVWLGVTLVWTLLMSLIGVPFHTPWHVVWIVPPFVIAFFMTRPVIEGKRLTELLLSQARYLAEARVYTRLAPQYEPAEITVTARVWHRDPAAGPLPEVNRKAARRAARHATAAQADQASSEPLPLLAARPEGAAEPVAPAPARSEPAAADPAPPAERATPPVGAPAEAPARRSVGLRVLNYFGFALPRPEAADTAERARPAADRGGLATVRRREEAPSVLPTAAAAAEPAVPADPAEVPAAEAGGAEGRSGERNPWLAAPRTPPGEAPWPIAADSLGTGRESAADDRAAARRRAEEIMAAPVPGAGQPEADEAAERPAAAEHSGYDAGGERGHAGPGAEHAAASDGVATPEEHAAESRRAEAPEDEPASEHDPWHGREAQRRLRGRAQGAAVARRLEQERAAAVERPAPERACGLGAPAAPGEDRDQRPRTERPRPHAAPWELPAVGGGLPAPGRADSAAAAAPLDAAPPLPELEAAPEHGARSAVAGRSGGDVDPAPLPPGAAAPAEFPEPAGVGADGTPRTAPARPEAAPDETGAAFSYDRQDAAGTDSASGAADAEEAVPAGPARREARPEADAQRGAEADGRTDAPGPETAPASETAPAPET
ncbi:TcpE family conjugal transfer membrane protein, partial [Marinitenerispora sediminis]